MKPVTIHQGDSRDVLKGLADNSIDSVVTDPPYALVSIVKRFGGANAVEAKSEGASGVYKRASAGFMGKTWDTGETAFAPEFWAEVMRVLKPGGHVVAASGTRTYHRLACAIEDAGFEVRDMISWNYGSGFPKSHNIVKRLQDSGMSCRCHKTIVSNHHVNPQNLRDLRIALDAREPLPGSSEQNVLAGLRCESDQRKGKGEAAQSRGGVAMRDVLSLDPSSAVPTCQERIGVLQPIVPLEVVCGSAAADGWKHEGAPGHSADGREEPSLAGRGDAQEAEGELQGCSPHQGAGVGAADGAEGRLHHGASAGDGSDVRVSPDADGGRQSRGSQPSEQSPVEPDALSDERGPQAWGGWPVCPGCLQPVVPEGYGTALKPACEPWVLARKPLSGTVAGNVLAHGTGALNIGACRIEGESTKRTKIGGANQFPHEDDNWTPKTVEVGSDLGRWPANVIHDGSDEVVEGFPDTNGGGSISNRASPKFGGVYGDFRGEEERWSGYEDTGSAARFFYSAKADADDRMGSKHPTVKPIDLMRYLVRLITPPGGVVLDPFAGSGSTGVAAMLEGFESILIEREAEYVADTDFSPTNAPEQSTETRAIVVAQTAEPLENQARTGVRQHPRPADFNTSNPGAKAVAKMPTTARPVNTAADLERLA